MIKDTNFYNKESASYSEKRYPDVPKTYTQFFFKERLRLTLQEVDSFTSDKNYLSLLEVGCADGVVVKAIVEKYGEKFIDIEGIDIAPDMISAASQKVQAENVSFAVRNMYEKKLQDIIIEIGVINYANLEEELGFIASQLKKDGVAIISLAGKGSLWDHRRKSETGFNNFLSYRDYEIALQKRFTIKKIIPVGLDLPLIWRMSTFALPIQKMKENFARPILPNLFHEKIYVLTI